MVCIFTTGRISVLIASPFSWLLLAHPVLYNTEELRLCYFAVSWGSEGPADATGRKRLVNRNVRWIRSYHESFINPWISVVFVPSVSTLKDPTFCPQSVFVCFVRISEQTAIISLYSIDWLGFCNRDGARLLRDTDWVFIHRPLLSRHNWRLFVSLKG